MSYVSILLEKTLPDGKKEWYLHSCPPILSTHPDVQAQYQVFEKAKGVMRALESYKMVTAAPTKSLGVFWLEERPGSWLAVEGKRPFTMNEGTYNGLLFEHQEKGHIFR